MWFTYWFVRATSVDQMEKILVKWCCKRSSGTTSLIKITVVKERTAVVGQKVTVAWGKSKKTYEAEVVSAGPDTSTTHNLKDRRWSVYFWTGNPRSADFRSYVHSYRWRKALSEPAIPPAAVSSPWEIELAVRCSVMYWSTTVALSWHVGGNGRSAEERYWEVRFSWRNTSTIPYSLALLPSHQEIVKWVLWLPTSSSSSSARPH